MATMFPSPICKVLLIAATIIALLLFAEVKFVPRLHATRTALRVIRPSRIATPGARIKDTPREVTSSWASVAASYDFFVVEHL
ncbi:hypothetical protein ACP4OV_002240 [Aristida adscensionis]